MSVSNEVLVYAAKEFTMASRRASVGGSQHAFASRDPMRVYEIVSGVEVRRDQSTRQVFCGLGHADSRDARSSSMS